MSLSYTSSRASSVSSPTPPSTRTAIVVGVDGSDQGERAVEWAIAEAKLGESAFGSWLTFGGRANVASFERHPASYYWPQHGLFPADSRGIADAAASLP